MNADDFRGPAVRAEGLTKRFGRTVALSHVDLEVERGTIVGLLGPNGAGKTTMVRVLTTLLRPDAGSATVTGIDVLRQPLQVRTRIGLAGQQAAVDAYLTGRGNLEMIGRLYHLGARRARRRADELLGRFSLADAADRIAKTYSGGMRRRLDLAASLVAVPPVLFLDEPTTGLDPRSRLAMWDIIRDLVDGGTTVLLTTQYLDEADRLADRIVVIDEGAIVGSGTSDSLKREAGGARIDLQLQDGGQVEVARAAIRAALGREVDPGRDARRLTLPVADGAGALMAVARALDDAGVEVEDIALRRPTLDEVFLVLTGHAAAQEEHGEERRAA